MTRGDTIGLGALLVLGIGATLLVLSLRAEPAPDPAPGRDPVATLSAEPGGRRVAAGPERPLESQARLGSRFSKLNSEAIAALEAGEHARAIELFEECLAGEPQEPVFAANLAEALARLALVEYEELDTRAAAIERLARAVELAPDRDGLRQRLAQWRKVADAEEGFWTDESAHFALSYDGARAELLERGYALLLEELERAYQDFGELFGRYPVEAGRPKIQVVLYRREQFSELTGIGHWAGGVFDGVVRVPVEELERERDSLVRVLRHELVHAFVADVGGRAVPGWLNEGLAQWLETPYLAERTRAVDQARAQLTSQGLFPLERLAGSLARWTDVGEIRAAYAQSLALVGHLERYYGERLLFELVAGCGAGASCADTFRQRTGLALAATVEDLARGL